MNFLDRFTGRGAGSMTANAALANPPSLQLLFNGTDSVPAEDLAAALRAYHPDLAAANVELMNAAELPGGDTVLSKDGPPAAVLGLIGWGKHIVKLAGFAAPMPAHAIEGCLQAALLPPEVKSDARAHQSHILLYYAGYEENPLEQYVALAVVSGVLAEFGAIITLNEEARTAILSTDLLPDQPGEDMMVVLRTLPIPYLYAGFVKIILNVGDEIWMRTFAAHRLKLPDLALRAAGHEEGLATFRLFSGLLGYLRETGLKLEPGEALRIDENTIYRVREPGEMEWWLDSAGPLWVLEPANRD